jgi:hypothetical protein
MRTHCWPGRSDFHRVCGAHRRAGDQDFGGLASAGAQDSDRYANKNAIEQAHGAKEAKKDRNCPARAHMRQQLCHSQSTAACLEPAVGGPGPAPVQVSGRSGAASIDNSGNGSCLLAGDFGSTSEWFNATASKKLAQINAPPMTTPRSISPSTPNEAVGNTSARLRPQQVY